MNAPTAFAQIISCRAYKPTVNYKLWTIYLFTPPPTPPACLSHLPKSTFRAVYNQELSTPGWKVLGITKLKLSFVKMTALRNSTVPYGVARREGEGEGIQCANSRGTFP